MRKSLWIMLAVMVVSVAAPHAHADTSSTFTVAGDATNQSGATLGTCASGQDCAFSGTITIDVTSGAATLIDLTFPGIADITTINDQFSNVTVYVIQLESSSSSADIDINTGSLTGFTGGTIIGDLVTDVNNNLLYQINGGTITAAVAAPEPSSVA